MEKNGRVVYDGEEWPSAEHAALAALFSDALVRSRIKNHRSFEEAFAVAKAHAELREKNWLKYFQILFELRAQARAELPVSA